MKITLEELIEALRLESYRCATMGHLGWCNLMMLAADALEEEDETEDDDETPAPADNDAPEVG